MQYVTNDDSIYIDSVNFGAFSEVGIRYSEYGMDCPYPELEANLFSGNIIDGYILLQVSERDTRPLILYNLDHTAGSHSLNNLWFAME